MNVDVFEEPYFVKLTKSNGRLIFQYKNKKITTTKEEAVSAFKETLSKFNKELLKIKKFEE